jgi:sporulation protein YlmC with PRC-barrel domain
MKRIPGVVIGTFAMLAAGTSMAAGKMEKSSAVSAPDISSSYKSSDLLDMSVQNRQNEDLGQISELIVDKDGKVSHVVLSAGGVAGVGGDEYIVPWDRITLSQAGDVAHVDVNKDALSSEFSAFEEDTMKMDDARKDERKSGDDKIRYDGKPSSTNP